MPVRPQSRPPGGAISLVPWLAATILVAFAASCVFDESGLAPPPGADGRVPDGAAPDGATPDGALADAAPPDAMPPDAVPPDGGSDAQVVTCGNGVREGTEQCDATDLAGASCQSLGLADGVLQCHTDCTFDFSGCTTCGNGALDPPEECDGAALGGETCQSLGLGGGVLACRPDCTYDFGGCTLCGNGAFDPGEECDGAALGGATCAALGFTEGPLSCGSDCRFDTSLCTTCGDLVVEGNEECDLGNLAGTSCQGLGHDGGVLACAADCRFDESGCIDCGDGVAEGLEQCDGADLRGASCVSRGHDSGTLACDAVCAYDETACADCGDGTVGGTEECDNGAANSDTQPDACRTDCTLPSCGDGVCDTAEHGQLCPADCTVVVFSETFEGAWPAGWTTGDNDGGSGTDTWAPVTNRSVSSNHSLQCAANGSHLTGNYDNDMQAWAVHAVNLSSTAGQPVTLTLSVWVHTDNSNDWYQTTYSPSAGTWVGLETISGDSGGWVQKTYDLSSQAGNANFVLGLYFESNWASSWEEGAYVDDIRITTVR